MKRKAAGDIFPEYYVLRVNDFDQVATTPLDEWIEFLKTGNISAKAKAAGLAEARECLRVDSLSEKDKKAYYRHMESIRHMKSLFETSRDEGYQEGKDEGLAAGRAEGRAEGIAEGRAECSLEIANQLKAMGLSPEQIAQATQLPIEEISKLFKQ